MPCLNKVWSLQAHFDNVTAALGAFSLQTLDGVAALPPDSPENAVLLGFAHLINDHRILVQTEPNLVALDRLPDLLEASAASPAATQAGLATYALLSPVISTLEDLLELARGDGDCRDAMLALEARVLETVGGVVCCLLYTSPSPRDRTRARMPSSA